MPVLQTADEEETEGRLARTELVDNLSHHPVRELALVKADVPLQALSSEV